MEWTRSETLALAQTSCTFCYGLGLRPGRAGKSAPCNCVLRAIFRACYEKFCTCVSKEKTIGGTTMERAATPNRAGVWGMRDEEFIADFCLVSRRILTEKEHRLFRYHYLLGADWKLCCAKLNMDRGNFFHEVYRIEQKLGRVFRELEPYPLFPVDGYFNGANRRGKERPHPVFGIEMEEALPSDKPLARVRRILRFPIKTVAAGSSGD